VDNSARSWAPSTALLITGWAVFAGVVVLTAFAADAAGRLFGVVTALVIGSVALFYSMARPRLAVDSNGVTVRSLRRARQWPWSRVRRIRVVRYHRLARETALLEVEAVDVDGEEELVVLGRLDLGAHPDEVLAAIHTVRGLT
jgi:Bacterial PH domain